MKIEVGILAFALACTPSLAGQRAPVRHQAPAINLDPLGLFSGHHVDPLNAAMASLQTFTVADLQAALDDANAQTPPDTVAAACYTALIPAAQSALKNPFPQKMGGFLLIQKARDLANGGNALLASVQGGDINRLCAPLVLSTAQTILGLQAKAIAAGAAIAILAPK